MGDGFWLRAQWVGIGLCFRPDLQYMYMYQQHTLVLRQFSLLVTDINLVKYDYTFTTMFSSWKIV